MMRKIRLEYFAVLREYLGRDSEEFKTSASTVADLYEELRVRYELPDFGPLKVAINDEFQDWQADLSDGDSVVFIPPVAGG